MRHILVLSVLTLLFFCTDFGETKVLTCFRCTKSGCRQSCQTNDGVCMTAFVVSSATQGRKMRWFIHKSCTSAAYCAHMGKVHTVSIGLGAEHFHARVLCCNNTNYCNRQNLRMRNFPPKNGKVCRFCDSMMRNCKMDECRGNQDTCVQVARNGNLQSGCATSNFCRRDPKAQWGVDGFAGKIRFPAKCHKPKDKTEPTTSEPITTTSEAITTTSEAITTTSAAMKTCEPMTTNDPTTARCAAVQR